jgi:cytokinin riboside 5'-monophosphate phosphoribohydrolase
VHAGGNVGLMGEVARTVLSHNGKVIGVIPEKLVPREVSGKMLGDTRVVANMHERKATMAAEAEAFIALPGGYVTFNLNIQHVAWKLFLEW